MAEFQLQKAVSLLPDGVDAALVTSACNRQYLLQFHSSAGVLLITSEEALFLVDSRYIEKAQKQISGCRVELLTSLSRQLQEYAKQHAIKTMAVESSYMTLREFNRYRQLLPGIELVASDDFDQALLKMRGVKTEEEIAQMQKAQNITDAAFTRICAYIKPGVTEKQIAAQLEFEMKSLGADGFAFDTIVVSGANSSMPHGTPTDKVVESGDFITMDFGAMLGGYMSDMTRTVAVGAISEEQKQVYYTVLEAQRRAMEVIRPGVVCKEVDAVARSFIAEAGFEGCFGHGLGHSLGVEIHEMPAFNLSDTTALAPGMVISVEPGIYLPGKFGVRIEDVIVVAPDGYRNFTKSPKELICL
ncbi:MAG: M24 family metallopeptidase [Oscillospiraceae bacterium]|jgi:Xaa-Pro aminopeptidase